MPHTASREALRRAYLSKVRLIHPDQFDRVTQHIQWERGHELLPQLNAAYGVLRNPRTRAMYDAALARAHLFAGRGVDWFAALAGHVVGTDDDSLTGPPFAEAWRKRWKEG